MLRERHPLHKNMFGEIETCNSKGKNLGKWDWRFRHPRVELQECCVGCVCQNPHADKTFFCLDFVQHQQRAEKGIVIKTSASSHKQQVLGSWASAASPVPSLYEKWCAQQFGKLRALPEHQIGSLRFSVCKLWQWEFVLFWPGKDQRALHLTLMQSLSWTVFKMEVVAFGDACTWFCDWKGDCELRCSIWDLLQGCGHCWLKLMPLPSCAWPQGLAFSVFAVWFFFSWLSLKKCLLGSLIFCAASFWLTGLCWLLAGSYALHLCQHWP